ncbi:Ribonuclease E [Aquisphaera giovannonii]|uniref:Ribonuclease G n=1 Tax=Aquisphaera giovannonii TaxID=406548 RepID=A0A5B9W6W1_9BACT|nr:Rne/Rng family ribonuclease [Aquisphaera giovannonii]QEH36077.1 Ribonuclease E [Aquisphaera giovannonii]
MKKEMLINVLQPEECRIAIVENGVLEELYVERTSHESYTGNIYKGKVVNLEPAIQAAFVDFSVGRNGFLHVSDVEPQYYQGAASAEDEPEPGAAQLPAPGARPREPRRDREDRRRPRPDAFGEPLPPSLPPPRSEDRPPRDRDRDRDRERPDRSIRGRRDRSEAPRSFGEGLADELGPLPQPPRAPEPPRPEPREPAAERREEVERASWTEAVERGWEYEREREREREAAPEEPAEGRWRSARPADFFDPDLPPSRTQRSRLPQPPAAEAEAPERGRYRPAEPPEAEPPREARDEEEIESFAPREPRRDRGRGRGRPSPPAGRPPRAPSAFDAEDLEAPDERAAAAPIEDEPDAFEPGPRADEPRRRGGRAAIRSRGAEGERDRDRDRERPREREAAPPEPAPAPPRYARPQPEHEPERVRPAEPAEPPRERARPHARAGEPGYVPRRERLRAADPSPEAAPDAFAWPEAARDDVPDIESREFLGADDEPFGPPEAAADARGEGRDGKRRRRRRGRRRDRDRIDEPGSPAQDEFAAELDDEAAEADFGPSFGRDADEEDVRRAGVRELDIEEIDEIEEVAGLDVDIDDHEDLLHDDDLADAPRVAEEEIDPELEQEIRKEIEEIEALEREMGLRGPAEARPRREDAAGRGGRAGRGRGASKPPIQEIFRRGDEVLVQVIKESIGTKGPTLSTYISIPGRYLVLMPGLNRVGVSRKIVDEGQRRKLREIMHELNPPKGLGFIVRTAGLERSKRELARDLAYLLRLWKVILRRIKKTRTPGAIYQESDMITRTIRDIFTSEIDTIWIDEPAAFERAQEFLRVVMPRFVNRIKLYEEKVPLFHKYGIEDEIAKIQRRHVPLPEGGSIVIDQTEALVAIDVNSGNFRVEDDAEKTAYEMNLRAAREIARQLRLRDLGGVIVNDFIDMREERHRRGVERALREAIKRDRARTKILRMSAFGLIEMTRQRIRPSLKRSVYEDCPNCTGSGVVKTAESMAIDVMRLLALASHREEIRRINVTVSSSVATYLNNRKRKEIARIEADSNMTIQVGFKENVAAEHLHLDCYDANNTEIRLAPLPPPGHGKRGH